MEIITKEWKEKLQPDSEEAEYRVNKQAFEKKPATYLKHEIEENERRLIEQRFLMEKLLIYEVKKWELLFWNKLKNFLDQIGNDRVEEKERLTREWRANFWKRLNPQMHAALKRCDDFNVIEIRGEWQLFEGVEEPDSISLSEWREWIVSLNESDNPQIKVSDMENEIEDNDSLFECRYSRSKWLHLQQHSSIPLEIYSHAQKGNKNITHISFSPKSDVNQFQATIRDLPWVTSISQDWSFEPTLPVIHRDPLFIKSTNNDLIKFAKGIRLKLVPFSRYIFQTLKALDSGRLRGDARVLISFIAPTSGQSLILKLKHSGSEDAPLEVTLGPTIIQLNPSSKSLPTIDDTALHPIQDPGSSESDYPGLSFEPGVQNDIIIDFR